MSNKTNRNCADCYNMRGKVPIAKKDIVRHGRVIKKGEIIYEDYRCLCSKGLLFSWNGGGKGMYKYGSTKRGNNNKEYTSWAEAEHCSEFIDMRD